MKRLMAVAGLLCCFLQAYTQASVTAKLSAALRMLERDTQLKAAITSLYVVDAKTGRTVFERNAGIGLAPASTQKIITAATAYALLGKEFRYRTELRYTGSIKDSLLLGSVFIKGDGDPTFGSWRWKETRDTVVINKWIAALKQKGIAAIDTASSMEVDESGFERQSIPDGWIWQDLGNYYGAGSRGLNWKENQFDLVLRSGSKIGDPVTIVQSGLQEQYPLLQGSTRNDLRSAAKGSGDNAYIYFPLFTNDLQVIGTIPVNENRFTISGAIPNPPEFLMHQFGRKLVPHNFRNTRKTVTALPNREAASIPVATHTSPPLDSIIFWFQKRSINLYGEALVKSFSRKATGYGGTDTGLHLLQEYWKKQGIAKEELNMVDGSGLSPLNRVTTRAQVAVLQFARQQPWFEGYFHSFPEFNGMKMKSGTIRGVKGFAGYHTSKSGTEYIFSFIVNNYNGSSAALVRKMYAVLDVLK